MNRFDDLVARRDDLLDAIPGLELEILDEREEQRIRHRDREQVLLDGDRDARALERDVLRNEDDRRGVRSVFRQVDVRKTELIGERLRDLAIGGEIHAHQYRPKPLS